MKITYSIWQGSMLKGINFTATTMNEVNKVIDELNSSEPKIKFESFISKLEQN